MDGAAEQNRKGRRRRVAHPKFVCRYDGSERNYMRSLRTPGGACHCGLRIKIRRDDSNNCPRNQQRCDKFEPAIHGNRLNNYNPKLSPCLSNNAGTLFAFRAYPFRALRKNRRGNDLHPTGIRGEWQGTRVSMSVSLLQRKPPLLALHGAPLGNLGTHTDHEGFVLNNQKGLGFLKIKDAFPGDHFGLRGAFPLLPRPHHFHRHQV